MVEIKNGFDANMAFEFFTLSKKTKTEQISFCYRYFRESNIYFHLSLLPKTDRMQDYTQKSAQDLTSIDSQWYVGTVLVMLNR